MRKLIKILFTSLFIMISSMIYAQSDKVQMADTMRSNGKIYVIVAIILIVLAGLIIYLFTLDKKLTRLEKRLEGK